MKRLKFGFTLIELIVVIAIIGLLVSVLVGKFGGATESSRRAKCMSNLRSISQACYSAAMNDSYKRYPHAGSCEFINVSVSTTGESTAKYGEHPGWISWYSKGKYNNKGYASSHQSCQNPGVYSSDDEIEYAYTNGAIWKAVSSNSDVYKCPTTARDNTKNGKEMAWTYAMSSFFCYDTSEGSEATETDLSGRSIGFERPDRRLMFAEICMEDINGGGTGDAYADCVLEYGDGTKQERIGFNHEDGRYTYAHVAYADGHVDKILRPVNSSKSTEVELTKWLCEGYDVVRVGNKYEKVENSVDDD